MFSRGLSPIIFVGINITLITVTQTQLSPGVISMAVVGRLFSCWAFSLRLQFWQLQANARREQHLGTHLGGHCGRLPHLGLNKGHGGTPEIGTGQSPCIEMDVKLKNPLWLPGRPGALIFTVCPQACLEAGQQNNHNSCGHQLPVTAIALAWVGSPSSCVWLSKAGKAGRKRGSRTGVKNKASLSPSGLCANPKRPL